jgi:pimeloyl-ACP methyl ester carboxylesterase
VAQLLWRRHRDRVAGLVLCATGGTLVPRRRDRVVFTTAMTAAVETLRLGQLSTLLPRALLNTVLQSAKPARPRSLGSWAALEMARHDWRMLLEAGVQLGRFDASDWLGEIDVPTAVVVTTQDRALGPMPQLQLARSIRGATIHAVDDGHVACARESFAAPLVVACNEVAQRAARRHLAQAS